MEFLWFVLEIGEGLMFRSVFDVWFGCLLFVSFLELGVDDNVFSVIDLLFWVGGGLGRFLFGICGGFDVGLGKFLSILEEVLKVFSLLVYYIFIGNFEMLLFLIFRNWSFCR